MVCAGVYLLTPSKRAYLRYYKDLENDILGRRRSLQTVDVEALVPEGPMAADRKFAAALSKSMGSDTDEVRHMPRVGRVEPLVVCSVEFAGPHGWSAGR